MSPDIGNSHLAPSADGAETPNDNGRRERRGGRGDNRRRQGTEGVEAAPQTLMDENAPATDAAATASDSAEGEAAAARAPRERRSRDRYGRDRRGDRGPREGEATDAAPGAEAQSPVVVSAAEETIEQRPTRSYFAQPAAPVAAVAVEAVAQHPLVAVVPTTAPVAAPAPVAPVASTGMPKVAPYALSMDELSRVAQDSGLEWINSDAAKVAQVQAAIAAEPQPIHVPREPRPVVLVDEGPLVLVETRKDLGSVTLPFEGR